MGAWKKTKKRNYILNIFRKDAWGKYARKLTNKQVISKPERYIKYQDELLYKVVGSPFLWFFRQLLRRRETFPYKTKEEPKDRIFRTRKILQQYYSNLNFHNIKIHIKKAGLKNGLGYSLNFYKMLERRLDVMCVRVFFYSTLKEAKQFIKNGFITVNNQVIKSCNYILKDKDILSVREDVRLQYKIKYLSNLLKKQIIYITKK